VLSAAAYRWGLRATLATAGAAVALYGSGAFLSHGHYGTLPYYLSSEFELDRVIMRCFYLLITGFLLGYLGEGKKLLRLEASETARITAKIQSETGVRAAVQDVLDEVCLILGSKHALIILNEATSGRLFLWQARRPSPALSHPPKLLQSSAKQFDFKAPAQAWHAVMRLRGPARGRPHPRPLFLKSAQQFACRIGR